jgi:hypothetical protein
MTTSTMVERQALRARRFDQIAVASSAWLGPAFEGLSIYLMEPETWTVSRTPFEVVDQTPVDVSKERQAVRQARAHTGKRLLEMRKALVVVNAVDAVFGDQHRRSAEGPNLAQSIFKDVRISLVSRLVDQRPGACGEISGRSCPETIVGLHAYEMVA